MLIMPLTDAKRLLPKFYDAPFERREVRYRMALEDIANESASLGKGKR